MVASMDEFAVGSPKNGEWAEITSQVPVVETLQQGIRAGRIFIDRCSLTNCYGYLARVGI